MNLQIVPRHALGKPKSTPGGRVYADSGKHTGVIAAVVYFSLVLSIPALISNARAAEIYRWIDDKGNVHFSDRPSVNQATETVIIKDPVIENPEYHQHLEKQSRLLEIYGEERREKDQIKKVKRKETEKRKANCILARQLLENTRNAQYLYEETDDPLNPRILSNEERLEETAREETEVKHWCE